MRISTLPLLAWAALALGYAPLAEAQQQFPCLHDHALEQMEQQYPGFRTAVQQTQLEAARRGAEAQGRRTILEIPVIVHVVWRDTAERLPECKIIEQIDILNEDFNRLNADAGNLRSIFQGVAAPADFRFRLDSIIWKRTDSLFFSTGFLPDPTAGNKAKRSASGGSDGLNPRQYLNFWICNLGNGGVLGFAYPPAGLSNWPANSNAPSPDVDGVLVDYRAIGRSGLYQTTQFGQTTTIVTQGRTPTHEFGHYFGLRHIWGDGLGAQFGVPNCTDDDGVADTPMAGLPSQFQCDTAKNSCGAGTAGDLPDMIENFMDYATESCMNTFTQGQVNIMRGVVLPSGPRDSLPLTPYLGPNRPANDALPHAQALEVYNATCVQMNNYNNQFARPSMEACQGQGPANDVWFGFRATSNELILELDDIQALSGSGDLVVELVGGLCGNLQSLRCERIATANSSLTFSNLTVWTDYRLRVYSYDSTAAHRFNICMRTPDGVVATQALAEQPLRLYPNPSAGLFHLELPDAEGLIEIFNALGQPILRQQVEAQDRLLLDLQHQAPGMYFLSYRSAQSGAVQVLRLQVQKP